MPAGVVQWVRLGCLREALQGRFGGELQPAAIPARGHAVGLLQGWLELRSRGMWSVVWGGGEPVSSTSWEGFRAGLCACRH